MGHTSNEKFQSVLWIHHEGTLAMTAVIVLSRLLEIHSAVAYFDVNKALVIRVEEICVLTQS